MTGPFVLHGHDERRELALAELADEQVVGDAARHAGRQDRRVRGVEADVQERRAQDQQHQQRRDEEEQRPIHDPVGESAPGALALRFRRGDGPAEQARDAFAELDRIRVDARSERGEDRGQQRHGARNGQADDRCAGDADRAQDHELEQDQADQPEQDGQAAEEHGAARGRDSRGDCLVDRRLGRSRRSLRRGHHRAP